MPKGRSSSRGRKSGLNIVVIAVIAIGAIVVAIVKTIVEAIANMPPGGQIGLASFVLAAAFVGIAVKVGWAQNWLALVHKQKVKIGGLSVRYSWFRWWYAPLALGGVFLTILIVLAAAASGGQPHVVYVTVTPAPTVFSTQEPTTRSAGTKAPMLLSTAKPTARPTARPTNRPTLRPRPTAAPVNCCKHCGPNSKPCGDSCISRDKACHKVGGCACP